MGAPIGDQSFCRAFLQAAVEDAEEGLRRLSFMPKRQHRLAMIQQSFARRLNHIQRLVPTNTPELIDLLVRYDDALATAVSDLLQGRGTFTALARRLTFHPAGLGGLGVESAVARADAAYLSSVTSASTRLAIAVPLRADLYAPQRGLPVVVAAAAALQRLTDHYPEVSTLIDRISAKDEPQRVQAKIMAIVQAATHDRLMGELPNREAAQVASAAEAPYLVTIVPNGDPSLELTNDQLASALARRLCVPQLINQASNAQADHTFAQCTQCHKCHAREHLDEPLMCRVNGMSGRTRWHNCVQREIGAFINSTGHHNRLEPPGVDPTSGKRADGECNSLKPGGLSVFWDVNTCVVATGDDKHDGPESAFPGLTVDVHEHEKTRYHAREIEAHREGDEFVPLVLDTNAAWGPQALDLFRRFARATDDPAATLAYRLRRLAVTTARELHHIMHGGLRTRNTAGHDPPPAPHDAHTGGAGPGTDDDFGLPGGPLEGVERWIGDDRLREGGREEGGEGDAAGSGAMEVEAGAVPAAVGGGVQTGGRRQGEDGGEGGRGGGHHRHHVFTDHHTNPHTCTDTDCTAGRAMLGVGAGDGADEFCRGGATSPVART